jgi:hypothetical protein
MTRNALPRIVVTAAVHRLVVKPDQMAAPTAKNMDNPSNQSWASWPIPLNRTPAAASRDVQRVMHAGQNRQATTGRSDDIDLVRGERW